MSPMGPGWLVWFGEVERLAGSIGARTRRAFAGRGESEADGRAAGAMDGSVGALKAGMKPSKKAGSELCPLS